MKENENYIAIYSRKSKFTGKGESIGNQIELCKEYIQTHYGEIPQDHILVYEDEGFSGGDLNRPDFKKMMKAAQNRRFRAIIVYRLDRISRNISDFSSLIEELSRLDIAFISIREQFDTGTPMGRAMMYIASVFSQLERETIAERIRDNMHELAKTGRWLGGTTPTGYASEAVRKVTIDGKAKKACKLKLIPEEAEIIRLIFDLYIEYDSLTATERELMKRGVKTKNNKLFTRFSIKSILQNPVYMIADEYAYDYLVKENTDLNSDKKDFDGIHGIMAYNRTKQERGKAVICLPPDEWIVAVGLHPGIIPGKVWISVQDSLTRNKNKAYRKPRDNEALLTGLLYCTCGSRMYPRISKRKNSDDKPIYTYVCRLKERSKCTLCNSKNANGNALDLAVVTQIKTLEDDKGSFIGQLKQNRKFYTKKRASNEDHLASMRKEKADLKKKIEGLVDSLAELEDNVVKTHVARRIDCLNQKSIETDSHIHELEVLASQPVMSDMESDAVCRMLSAFKSSIDEMTVEQKRSAIRILVRKIIWNGTNAHIILFGVQDDDAICSLSHQGEDSK